MKQSLTVRCVCGYTTTDWHDCVGAPVTRSAGDEAERLDVLADLTDDEMVAVDKAMDDHMYGHSISNSYANFRCDAWCRTRALGEAFRRCVLVPRRAAERAARWAEHETQEVGDG